MATAGSAGSSLAKELPLRRSPLHRPPQLLRRARRPEMVAAGSEYSWRVREPVRRRSHPLRGYPGRPRRALRPASDHLSLVLASPRRRNLWGRRLPPFRKAPRPCWPAQAADGQMATAWQDLPARRRNPPPHLQPRLLRRAQRPPAAEVLQLEALPRGLPCRRSHLPRCPAQRLRTAPKPRWPLQELRGTAPTGSDQLGQLRQPPQRILQQRREPQSSPGSRQDPPPLRRKARSPRQLAATSPARRRSQMLEVLRLLHRRDRMVCRSLE
mmetsp:Transcript_30879/g.54416  ORF Transcript_30879/g.54416 Transcript_30879/m.54416 type:complete len:269 (+) Transcript_30879:1595-2401(+)